MCHVHLPPDVLIDILGDAAGLKEDPVSFSWFSRLHMLAQVCKNWLDIILNSPELWTTVHNYHTTNSWKAALRLSRTSNIAVHYRTTLKKTEFLPVVLSQLHRWKSADLSYPPEEDLATLEQDRAIAPALESLKLHLSRAVDLGTRGLNLLPGGAPNVRHLDLGQVALRDWTSSILRSEKLTCLHLSGTIIPNIQHLVEALEASAGSLTTLGLVGVSLLFETDSNPNWEAINLQQLEQLELDCLQPSAAVLYLLTKLQRKAPYKTRIPACKDFRLGLPPFFPGDLIGPTCSIISKHLSYALGTLDDWSRVTFETPFSIYEPVRVEISSSNSTQVKVEFRLRGIKSVAEVVSWAEGSFLAPALASTPQGELILIEPRPYGLGTIPSWIRSITVRAWSGADIVQTLDELTNTPGLVPDLQRFSLVQCSWGDSTEVIEALRRFSEARAGAGNIEIEIRECGESRME